jgi:GxxExxY protein
VYQNALLIELRAAGLKAEDSHRLTVTYEGHTAGDFVADIFVEDEIILENKACNQLVKAHQVQLVNYLTATQRDVGVLLNFGGKSLEFHKKFRIAIL